MNHSPTTSEERYAALAETLRSYPDVTPHRPGKKGFGSSALCIGDKIFVMLVKGKLVLKLPRQQVDALVAAGQGERFDLGHGRLMKEWLVVEPTSEEGWLSLAREAMAFVAPKR